MVLLVLVLVKEEFKKDERILMKVFDVGEVII